jgi:hypothetical protein
MKLPVVPDAERDLVVNEMFGPTFQGEDRAPVATPASVEVPGECRFG